MLRDRERDRRSAPNPARVDDAGRRRILCATCGHPVTDNDYRIAMSGAHEHTFVNPAGIVHHIRCFSIAPGCAHVGEPDATFSWFPGWTWQIAICARCQTHLGWLYRNADEQFYGLIVRAIREA